MRQNSALKTALRYFTFVGLLAAFPATAMPATHYVWCGASFNGDGSSFQNPSGAGQPGAFTDLPTSLVRGDTYYIAGSSSCTYGKTSGKTYREFNDDDSGGLTISVIHATAANSGSVTGWQAPFGTTPAKWAMDNTWINGWLLRYGHYTFDGQFGSGENNDSYGFLLQTDLSSMTAGGSFIFVGNGTEMAVNNVTFRHVEIDGTNCCGIPSSQAGWNGVFFTSTSGYTYDAWDFSQDYIHDISAVPYSATNVTNLTIENSVMARNRSTSQQHAEGLSAKPVVNLISRYNVWEDIQGTGVYIALSGSSANWQVYGDVVLTTTGFGYGSGVAYVNAGSPGGSLNGLTFYNNTIYNIKGGSDAGVHCDSQSAGCSNFDVQNNLWYQNDPVLIVETGGICSSACTHDYNTILNGSLSATTQEPNETVIARGAANPFAAPSSKNFQLLADMGSASNSGLATAQGHAISGWGSLPSGCTVGVNCFNVDPLGNLRGLDGTVDRGAFEFTAVTLPNPPTGLTVTGVH